MDEQINDPSDLPKEFEGLKVYICSVFSGTHCTVIHLCTKIRKELICRFFQLRSSFEHFSRSHFSRSRASWLQINESKNSRKN